MSCDWKIESLRRRGGNAWGGIGAWAMSIGVKISKAKGIRFTVASVIEYGGPILDSDAASRPASRWNTGGPGVAGS